jgi:transcriptional regulator with XRE-family HTH domain
MPGRKKGKSEPNPIDVRVGHRIKARRVDLKFSQTELADHLGVTFQQVQKYEKGRNRVGASRLTQIARFLNVSPSYFFEGTRTTPDKSLRNIEAFVASGDGMALIEAMTKVGQKGLRRQIAMLFEEIANTYYAKE